ncbi:MAG TPA: hypothetical protein VG982_01910 [Candidatus Paceibacterota bacterium]|jgi:hypothetical protein|nr:hypothetical protein [Candidatus Paceibacterota bacterium]
MKKILLISIDDGISKQGVFDEMDIAGIDTKMVKLIFVDNDIENAKKKIPVFIAKGTPDLICINGAIPITDLEKLLQKISEVKEKDGLNFQLYSLGERPEKRNLLFKNHLRGYPDLALVQR